MPYPNILQRLAETVQYLGTAAAVERWVRDNTTLRQEVSRYYSDCVVAGERDQLPPLMCDSWGERLLNLDDHDHMDLSDYNAILKDIKSDIEILAPVWRALDDTITNGSLMLTRNLRDIYAVEIGIMDKIVDHVAESSKRSPRACFSLEMVN